MTWDEIYNLADGKGYGDFELERKDNARYDVVCFVEDNFGFNLENERDKGVIESVEEWIDYYVDKYEIVFDDYGHIIKHKEINASDKEKEIEFFNNFNGEF